MKHPHDGWNPKRYDPKPDHCDKCSWRDWETVVWIVTALVCFYLLMIMLASSLPSGSSPSRPGVTTPEAPSIPSK